MNLTILKLGGSVITRKEEPLSINMASIQRLSNEIAKSNVKPLVIVHGGGSFGHPAAKEYALKEGYRDKKQLYGLAKTHLLMLKLNEIVVEALLENGVAAIPVHPSSSVLTRNGRIVEMNISPVIHLLGLGLLPILYGDISFDQELGFTILSGDQLVSYLACRLEAKRIVLGIDVDGVYASNPRLNPGTRLIPELDLKSFSSKLNMLDLSSSAVDVTGGMGGKLQELITPLENGVEIILVNALKSGRVFKALRGDPVTGTIMHKGDR
jgi:isopentenyl phosphate kinase